MSFQNPWIPLLALVVLAGCSNSEESDRRRQARESIADPVVHEEALPSENAPEQAAPQGKADAEPQATPPLDLVVKWPAEKLIIVGELQRKVVAEVLAAHEQDIRSCYEKYMKRYPMSDGELRLEWIVRPDGRVATVKVRNDSMGNPSVMLCLMSRLRKWSFLEPAHGSVVVTQTFVVSPGSN